VPETTGNLLTLSTQVFKKHAPDDQTLQQYLDSFDDKVWKSMRAHEEIPHIGVVYTAVVNEFTTLVMQTVMPDIHVIVDDNELYIDSESIDGWRDFNRVYKAYEEAREAFINDPDYDNA